MKTLFISLTFLLIGFTSLAQEVFTKKNTIAIGTYHPSIGISYDRIWLQKSAWKFSSRISINSFNFKEDIVAGLGLYAFRGKRYGHIQFGLNYTFWNSKNYVNSVLVREGTSHSIIPSIGYRYQRPNGGLFFTTNVGPRLGLFEGSIRTDLHINLGIGFSF